MCSISHLFLGLKNWSRMLVGGWLVVAGWLVEVALVAPRFRFSRPSAPWRRLPNLFPEALVPEALVPDLPVKLLARF